MLDFISNMAMCIAGGFIGACGATFAQRLQRRRETIRDFAAAVEKITRPSELDRPLLTYTPLQVRRRMGGRHGK